MSCKKFLYYAEGSLYSCLSFQEGQKEGLQEFFYPDGKLKTREYYIHGRLNGKMELYWPNGYLKREVFFVDGIRSGWDRMWNSIGILVDEGMYENGCPIGIHRRFHQTGQILEEINYLDTKRFDFRSWDIAGVLRVEALWLDERHYTERDSRIGFERVKASGFSDHKRPSISNTRSLVIAEPRELSRSSKPILESRSVYIENTWDRFQNIWVEKKGTWDGRQLHFVAEEISYAPERIPCEREKFFTYEENHSLLMENFPKLGLFLSSEELDKGGFEALSESDLSGKQGIGKAECIYVYGLGGGASYFQLKHWLHESSDRKLVFLEDQSCCFSSLLHFPGSGEILMDHQVHFELIGQGKDALDAVTKQFPMQRIEVFALPSRKGRYFQSLRLQLFRKTALSHALHLDRLHGYQPFQHFVKNIAILPNSFYANALKDAFQGMPVIVCGAGPSLNQAIPLLKELSDRVLIIAGGSTLAALSSQGVPIHFGIAVDPNLEEYRRFKNNFSFETPLLYSTRVNPLIFQTCNGPFGYMRSGIGGVGEIWMEEELGLFDPLIGTELSPESISVTTICVAWAQFLGCGPIFFSGIDLAYTGQKRYAAGVETQDDEPIPSLDFEKSAPDRIFKRKDRLGNPIYTATRWMMEASALSHFAKKHKNCLFFNTTEGGLPISGIPYISLLEAANTYLQKKWDIISLVQEKIAKASMPFNSALMITNKMDELKESFYRMKDHLEILAGKTKGSLALAEYELQEEMATSLFFYDMQEVLERDRSLRKPLASQEKWDRFLKCVLQYLEFL